MDANTKAKLEAMQKASKRAAAIRETREHFLTMRKGMEMKISKRVRISVAAILWLLCAGMALAETVHVRSTRIESRNELMPGNQRPGLFGAEYQYTAYTVESANRLLVLESATTHRLQIGQDYEVAKATDDGIVLLVPTKNGKLAKVEFYIKAAEELAAK